MKKLFLSACLLLPFASGCHKPTAEDHVKKGDQYLKEGKLPDAILEYRGAVQLEPKRGDVHTRLADAYVQTGDMRASAIESVRAADVLPNDLAAQLRAGNMLLLGKAFEDAKTRANRALELDPKNGDALILRGNALAGLKQFDAAMNEYQEAVALAPGSDAPYANMAAIQSYRGQAKEAEANFRKAVEVAPKSVQAHLALANFLWAAGRIPETEQTLKEGLASDPKNPTMNRAMGLLCLVTNRVPEAEQYFRALADASNTVESGIALADYYTVAKRTEEARMTLKEVSIKPGGFSVAQTRLAAIDAAAGLRAPALKRLQEVLDKQPKDMAARLLSARLMVADGRLDDASKMATSIYTEDPNSPLASEAYAAVGQIEAMIDHPEEATRMYEEALKRNPRSVQPAVALAALSLLQNQLVRAKTYVRQALSGAPDSPVVQAMNVRVLLAEGNAAEAKTQIEALRKAYPKSPTVMNLVADQQVLVGQNDAARQSYAAAVAMAPNDLEATTGLVKMDLASGRAKEAVALVESGMKTGTPNSHYLVLAARTYASAGQLEQSEALLKRAITEFPGGLDAYGFLGQIYVQQHRLDEAEQDFRELVRRNPKSVGSATMVGMLLEAQKKVPEAIRQYQAVMAVDPRAAVAANNLAWIYADQGQNLDMAMNLAQVARQQLPNEPHVADTLGWIYYKKKLATQAVDALQASLKVAPDDPGTHYHLGKAYILYGDLEKAKKELRTALASKGDFADGDDARKTLASIGG